MGILAFYASLRYRLNTTWRY